MCINVVRCPIECRCLDTVCSYSRWIATTRPITRGTVRVCCSSLSYLKKTVPGKDVSRVPWGGRRAHILIGFFRRRAIKLSFCPGARSSPR